MRATLIPLGYYKKFLPKDQQHWQIDFDRGITVKELLANTQIKADKVPPVILVNGRHIKEDYQIQDGDEVIVMTLLGGG
jgi:sulfur carrier protein ThiS